MKEKRVGIFRSQVCWLGGPSTRQCGWHVMVQMSCGDHVILESCYNSEVVGGGSNRCPGLGWRCDGVKPQASSRVWLDPIHGTCGILNKVGRVNPTEEMMEWLNGT